MATIFSRIAAGEIPSYKVAEDERHFAFLDINPVNEGHVLVIPRKETDYIFDLATEPLWTKKPADLSDEDYKALMLFAKRVAKALKKALPCAKVGMSVIGLDVPHVHVHLVPMNSGADMDFCGKKLTLPAERMAEIAESIAKNFE